MSEAYYTITNEIFDYWDTVKDKAKVKTDHERPKDGETYSFIEIGRDRLMIPLNREGSPVLYLEESDPYIDTIYSKYYTLPRGGDFTYLMQLANVPTFFDVLELLEPETTYPKRGTKRKLTNEEMIADCIDIGRSYLDYLLNKNK